MGGLSVSLERRKNRSSFSSAVAWVCVLFFYALFIGCSPAGLEDISNANSRRAVIEEVNRLLTQSNCDEAIRLITPLYDSKYSDNEIRMTWASAHACRAGLEYIEFLLFLQNNTLCTIGNCNGLWTGLTKHFYQGDLSSAQTRSDLTQAMYATWFSIEGLQATLSPGVVVPDHLQVNPGTNNVGSVLTAHRTDDANLYLLFVSMAEIGVTQNLYGQTQARPFQSNYLKTVYLPWINSGSIDQAGCAYASAILNMVDTAEVASATLDLSFDTNIITALDAACVAKCTTGTAFGGCGLSTAVCGSGCSVNLRNRYTCNGDPQTGVVADAVAECSARAVVDFVNNSAAFGWPCVAGGCP